VRLKKIISGGQTGVDQAALNAALVLRINCGGWCPPGRICENGRIADHFPLAETPYERSKAARDVPRSLRTEWNVRDSDATLIVMPEDLNGDKGIDWTLKCVETYEKPSLIINPYDDDSLIKIKEWLGKLKISILNVAGPSEKTYPGIGIQSYNLLLRAFKQPDNS
jgi:Circularly permutated YpsA SLOG family